MRHFQRIEGGKMWIWGFGCQEADIHYIVSQMHYGHHSRNHTGSVKLCFVEYFIMTLEICI